MTRPIVVNPPLPSTTYLVRAAARLELVLGREFFHFDAETTTLTGSDTGLSIGIGQPVTVRLVEAAPVTGGIGLELLTLRDKALPQGPPRGRGKPPKRKLVRAKRKSDKTKRKVARKRSS